eukprot:3193093-Heterocapsa_arctica.AAC.1
MVDPNFDIEQSTAIGRFVEMKEDPNFKEWTVQEKLDKLSSWMTWMTQIDKRALAAMGAMRMSQKQAI